MGHRTQFPYYPVRNRSTRGVVEATKETFVDRDDGRLVSTVHGRTIGWLDLKTGRAEIVRGVVEHSDLFVDFTYNA